MINFAKEREPMAIWYLYEECMRLRSEPKVQCVSLGWEELNKKIAQEGLDCSVLKNTSWDEDFNSEVVVVEFLKKSREDIKIGRYMVIDGINSLLLNINSSRVFDLNELRTYFYMGDFSVRCFISDFNFHDSDELYFTAPEKTKDESVNIRENILNGRQPLRTTSYYREQEGPSGDQLEGLSSAAEFKKYKKIGEGNSSGKMKFDSYVFSLHDNKITPEAKKKFGADTYKIIDIQKWIDEILDQVETYWLSKSSDYVGSIVVLKKVDYKSEKKMKKMENLEGEDEASKALREFEFGGANGSIKNSTFVTIEKCEYFFQTLFHDHFTKPKEQKYVGESETRLCIVPLYFNKDGAGFLLNNLMRYLLNDPMHHRHTSFDMNIKDYKNLLELVGEFKHQT